MNIAVSFNDQFLQYACVALTSLLENCASPISVHVLTADLSEDSENALRRLFAPFPNAELAVERVDDSMFKGIDMSKTHLSKETFFRFLLPTLFPSLDKILYLDMDLIVRGDVTEIFGTPLDGALVAAARDLWVDRDEPTGFKGKLGLSVSDTYINAGVMLINLDAWRAEDISSRAVRLMIEHNDDYPFFDQDALNTLFKGRVKLLDGKWNFTAWNYDRQKSLRKKAKILHYAGKVKPWNTPSRRWKDCAWAYYRLQADYILRTGKRPSPWRRWAYAARARHGGS